jgi:hypothetical protein
MLPMHTNRRRTDQSEAESEAGRRSASCSDPRETELTPRRLIAPRRSRGHALYPKARAVLVPGDPLTYPVAAQGSAPEDRPPVAMSFRDVNGLAWFRPFTRRLVAGDPEAIEQ